MCAYGASNSDVIDDVILVKSQSSKTSHSETRIRIDYPYGLLSVSVTEVTTCDIIVLVNLIIDIGVYT